MNVSRQTITQCLKALGIEPSDTVFFHSSLKAIGHVDSGPDTVIDAFLGTLGPEGTLVLPALSMYDWETMDDVAIRTAWDIAGTPTFTGIIPETARRRADAVRSDNPTHSVTAIGRHACEITRDHDSSYGAEWAVGRPKWASRGAFGFGSPWDRLYALDAKYLLIGVDFDRCTMLHHVQVLFLENHLGLLGCRAAWPEFDFVRMGRKLEGLGVVTMGTIGGAVTRVMNTRALVDTALRVLCDGALEEVDDVY